ncbi:N-glycosylase/DNA lyase [Eucyclogobius newberryi]|uniref:N-glycosylase/DNA lyase n=1 Tax=Eucyclogobius newberryi TaxID=166745 RepID=UPI003B59E3B8
MSLGRPLWRSLEMVRSELRLELTLACGQSFRWRETAEGHWTGVMGGRVWTLTQLDNKLWYYVYENQQDRIHRKWTEEESEPETKYIGDVKADAQTYSEEERLLKDYFQLNINLEELYKDWGERDTHFKKLADTFSGVRMLRQDPTECLFSFICTSNNHISRIQGMVERLCLTLGIKLCQLDETSYHDFPSLSALAESNVEACLRDLGFGYRAKFLQQSAKTILDSHGPHWLSGLRNVPYHEARDALRTLSGVGTKVADCVCLMSLDKTEAVPVDTHVWQIAKRDYKFISSHGQKTITDKLHRDIGDFFKNLWGPYAGWAQSVLFCSDLKKFQNMTPVTKKLKREIKCEEDTVKETVLSKIIKQENIKKKRPVSTKRQKHL